MEYSLREYIGDLDQEGLVIDYDIPDEIARIKVKNISYNSKDNFEQGVFICKGAHFKKEYLWEAIEKGAFCYISEEEYDVPDSCGCIIVKDIRRGMALLASRLYENAWKKLTLVGITGTKGKSTTAFFTKQIFDEYQKSRRFPESGILSSIDNYDGIIREESHLTTPETMDLHKHFDNAIKSGIEFLTMEVSSQALKYKRTDGITFDVGAFLNIGTDHISDVEHKDFEDYFSSKLLLLKNCKVACVNLETEHRERVLEASKNAERVLTFGFNKEADIYGYNVNPSGKGIKFTVKTDSFDEEFKIEIPGYFNVENALCAIAICYGLNIPVEYIKKGLKKAKVAGRMEAFKGLNAKGKEVNVIVDYAHNKMSFETLFKSVNKQYPENKITIVFGCPGKKALGRRYELGNLAGIYADKVIVTEEDPGEEDVYEICKQIADNVEAEDTCCIIEIDRKKAILNAINEADEQTIVLITGKGRETRQKRGTEYIDCQSDVDIVIECFGRNN